MSKREPVHHEHIPNKLRAESKYVKRFWEKHYRYKCDQTPQKVKVDEVFSLWKLCNPEVDIEFSRFNQLTRNLGVRVCWGRKKKTEYCFADPLTDLSNSYHGIGTGERPLTLNWLFGATRRRAWHYQGGATPSRPKKRRCARRVSAS